MLSDAPVSAVLPATDMAAAKDFYQNKLGLKLDDSNPSEDPLFFKAGGGTTLVVYKYPPGVKAENTAAGFGVKDLEAVIKELEGKGVKFEDYDLPNLKTVNHIMEYGPVKSAWAKDPAGNVIAFNQM